MGVAAITRCTRGFRPMTSNQSCESSASWAAIDLALGAAATARLARLVTRDSIFDRLRLQFVRRMDRSNHPKLAELAVCPWCISIWIGGLVALATVLRVPGLRFVTAALTFSLVAGVVNEYGTEYDRDDMLE